MNYSLKSWLNDNYKLKLPQTHELDDETLGREKVM